MEWGDARVTALTADPDGRFSQVLSDVCDVCLTCEITANPDGRLGQVLSQDFPCAQREHQKQEELQKNTRMPENQATPAELQKPPLQLQLQSK